MYLAYILKINRYWFLFGWTVLNHPLSRMANIWLKLPILLTFCFAHLQTSLTTIITANSIWSQTFNRLIYSLQSQLVWKTLFKSGWWDQLDQSAPVSVKKKKKLKGDLWREEAGAKKPRLQVVRPTDMLMSWGSRIYRLASDCETARQN